MANKKVTITYNGSQILPQTELTSSAIIYGSTTLVSDFVGTKTLNCANQVMNSNVIVGSKTLNCNGLLMNSNVSVTSIGMVGNKPTNLYPSATYNGSGIGNGYTTPANVTMTGNNSGTNAGTYTATYTPNTGYCWNDGDTSAVTVTLTINRASVGAKPSGATYNYTGGAFSPYNIPSGVSGSGTTSATDGGNYTAYYTPDDNHCWSDSTYSTVTVSWTIQYVWNRYNAVPYYGYNIELINILEGVTQQVLTGSTYIAYGNRLLDFNTNTGQWEHASGWGRESDYIGLDNDARWFWTTNDTSTGETYFSQFFECDDEGYRAYMYPNGTIVNTLSGYATVVKGTKYYSYVAGYNRGSYIDQVGNISNVYPSDGRHTDGYWYVKTW